MKIPTKDSRARIALLEDDPIAGRVVVDSLEDAGYKVDWFIRGIDCVRAVEKFSYDLCILDWVLPDIEGPEVLSIIGRNQTKRTVPVIFLTHRIDERDMVSMLEAGADDYVLKPVQLRSFVAKIGAHIRRVKNLKVSSHVQFGDLTLDKSKESIYLSNECIKLTTTEYLLGSYMLENVGRLVSRQSILRFVWKTSADIGTRKVDVHMSRVKKKLCLTPERGWSLSSVYGSGYRLDWLDRNSTLSFQSTA